MDTVLGLWQRDWHWDNSQLRPPSQYVAGQELPLNAGHIGDLLLRSHHEGTTTRQLASGAYPVHTGRSRCAWTVSSGIPWQFLPCPANRSSRWPSRCGRWGGVPDAEQGIHNQWAPGVGRRVEFLAPTGATRTHRDHKPEEKDLTWRHNRLS